VVRRLAGLCLWALLAASLAADTPAEQETPLRVPPRRLLLFFETAPGARLDDSQRLLLYESLLVRLGWASERVRVLEGAAAGSDEARDQAVGEKLADSWIHVAVDGTWDSLRIAVRSHDLLRQQWKLDYSLNKPLRRGAVDLERGFWDEVVESVREAYTEAGLPITDNVQQVTLELQAAPGTRIAGFSPRALRAGPEGTASAEVLLPATFEYRATRRGYAPLNEMVFLSPGQDSYSLPQQTGPRWAVDFYLYQFGFPGFDVAWHPRRGPWYLSLGLNTFLAGITLGGDREQLFTSLSLSHLNLATGLYLNEADRLFRFYLELGALARLITAADLIVTIDRVMPFAIQPALGMEFGRQPRRRFYLEYAPPFYYAPRTNLAWLSVPPEDRPPLLPIPFHRVAGRLEARYDWAFFWELAVFRLGVRWVL